MTLKKEEDSDVLLISFENAETERYSAFEVKLIDIDCEHLGIPETDYKCTVDYHHQSCRRSAET